MRSKMKFPKNIRVIVTAMIGSLGIMALAQRVDSQIRTGIVVRQQAPKDKAVDFPLATLQSEFASMDLKNISTVRLLEGGTYNVNIRRLVAAETALIHA